MVVAIPTYLANLVAIVHAMEVVEIYNKMTNSKILNVKQFNRLCNVAKKHIHKCDHRYKVVAIIFKKGKIISVGVNSSKKSYPFLKRYFAYASLHAEISALVSILYKDTDNLEMFVYRQAIDGSIKNAKPCPMCVRALYDSKFFKQIYWTTDLGGLETASIEQLHTNVMLMSKDKRFILNGK